MPKIVIHIFHADESSLGTGSHLAERIRQIKDERGLALEVYVFGPAEKALMNPDLSTFNTAIDGLVKEGIAVYTCIDIAKSIAAEEAFRARGIQMAYARDKFSEYALEGATIIGF
jgi:hypothetical protein